MASKGEDDRGYVPMWNGKVEDLELWEKRLKVFKLTKEAGKRSTCGPLVLAKMQNEENYHKYEKYLHGVDVERLAMDDGVDYLFRHIKNIAGVSEVQEIGQVLDKYFKINRKSECFCKFLDIKNGPFGSPLEPKGAPC